MPDTSIAGLTAAIATLESQRAALGDAMLDMALAPLRARLAALESPAAIAVPSVATVTPAAAAEPERRLRQVTILFLDIVGSTELIRVLDPEDVQLVVDGALAAFSGIVASHGGEVLRYAGDSVKAAFGSGGKREDDAERAVSCGLALLQEGARHGEAVRLAHGHAGFGVRVGVHTGDAVRGGGIETTNSLSGLAVNVAARMEQAAAPGTLRISIDTYRQVQGCFDMAEQPALQVKGLAEPMRTFLVSAARERRLRGLRHGVDGVASRLVGRDDQLGQLQRLAAAVFAPGGLGAVSVIGEAGLGKSRLLAEFEAGLPTPVRAGALWRASSHPQARHQPYGLLRDLLFWHHGVRDSDTQAQARQTFTEALAPIFGTAAEEQTALLGQLIGLDFSASRFVAGILSDGKQLAARGLVAWLQYLRVQAAVQPLVLVLDDLQWADDASLAAIDQLVAEAASLPIVLVCAARPELLERKPGWASGWPGALRLTLSPLAASGSEALATSLLARFQTPVPALHKLLTDQAAGNPYYMEALLQMLVDTGVIQTTGEHWQVQEVRIETLKVPPTLVGVLQATLDALSSAERRSLQQASVVGAQFWHEALAAIDAKAPDELLALSLRELALPQANTLFEGTREYHFRHHLLHQVTYGTVLRPDKREAHRHVALWLQGRGVGRETELAGQIADHFERAGLVEQAIDFGLRAAEDAAQRHADTAAMAHADRALALDSGTDLPRQAHLRRVRAQVLMRAGNAAEHHRELEILEALAERLDDDVLRLSLASDRMWRLASEGRFGEAVELGARRLALAGESSPADAARVHKIMASSFSQLGRHEEESAHASQGLEKARAAGDLLTVAAIHNNLGVGFLHASRGTEAGEQLQRSLETYRSVGSRNGAATACLNLAEVAVLLCRLGEARERLAWVLQECRDIGSIYLLAMSHANLSIVLCELAEHPAGYESALQSLQFAQISDDRWAQAIAHRGARMNAHALGLLPAALEHACAARAAYAGYGQQSRAWSEWAASIGFRHDLGQHAEAQREADALLAEVAEKQGNLHDSLEGVMHLHRALAAWGDSRAHSVLTAAHEGLLAAVASLAGEVPAEVAMRNLGVRREICDAWAAAGHGPVVATPAESPRP